jgi:hypothetical protein
MTLPVAPVSIIATVAMGVGTKFPAFRRADSTAAPTAMRRSTIGPTAWRLGTWEVKEGTSDAKKVGSKILRRLYLDDLLDKERNIPKLLVAHGNSVHLGIVNAYDLVIVYENEFAFRCPKQLIAVLFVGLQLNVKYWCHESGLLSAI